MKNYLWLETKSFLGSKNFFMRDCFQQRSNDSKPVEDFLRVVWTPSTYCDLNGVENGCYGWGCGWYGEYGFGGDGLSDGYGCGQCWCIWIECGVYVINFEIGGLVVRVGLV